MRRYSILLLAAASAIAQPSIEAINAEISRLPANHSRLQSLNRARLAALAELITSNPSAALRLALPEETLVRLRQNRSLELESRGQWTGPVDLVVEDDFEHHTTRTHTSLSSGGETLQLHFAAPPPKMTSETIVTVDALRLGNSLAVSQTTASASATALGCSTTGLQRIAVLLVNLPSSKIPASVNAASITAVVNSATGHSVDSYYREASNGLASATADVFGPFSLSVDYNSSQYTQVRNAAIAAAASTVTFTNYNHVAIVLPPGFPTGGGLGTIGCTTLNAGTSGTFRAGSIWIRSDFFATNDLGLCGLSHEGGHNLGLDHASSESFGSLPLGALTDTPTHDEYGDRFSMMGLCFTQGSTTLLGHFAAAQKITLGWLGSANYQGVTANGFFTLKPLESGGSGLQALRIQRAPNQWLWLEYRQPIGYDATFGSSGFSNQIYSGATVHFEDTDPTYTGFTRLLNFSAATRPSDFVQPALAANSTWTDPYTDLSITLGSATASGLNVSVNYRAAPAHIPSVVSLNPPVSAGSNKTYTFQFSDTFGAADLTVLNVLVNTALDGRRACYLAYVQQTNTLLLVNDGGDAGGPYAGSMVLNGSGSISNGQCTVFGSGSSANSAGTTLTMTLNMSFNAAFSGNKVLYLAARDSTASNTGWQALGTLAVAPAYSSFPNSLGMNPAVGAGANGIFSFTFQDATAATNLQTGWALFNNALDGRAACYVAYYRPANLLYLYPDNGDGSQATNIVLTGTNSISNSQCTVLASGSSVTVSGNQLILNLNMVFKSAFAGTRIVWLATQTTSGQTSPWQALARWQVM